MKRLALVVSIASALLVACSAKAEEVPPNTPTILPITSTPNVITTPTFLSGESPPRRAASEFSTDFSKHIVPYDEILSGGPPKDGIPAIDEPQFETVQYADLWLADHEPVIMVKVDEDSRAYPIQILIWHEIINDEVNGLPLTITFCPLCNTAIVFERHVGNQILDFGTTGRLRYSNLIMYDRQTETWWQQADGLAIAGDLTGMQLAFYPAAIISWAEFKDANPDGKVLSRETGYIRNYGNNPYTGYDSIYNSPFLYEGPETPNQLPPMVRVLTVDINEHAVAYTYDILTELSVINDTVGGQEIVILWQKGTTSPLDKGTIAGGREIGTAAAYLRTLDGKILSFTFNGERIIDQQTNSTWDALGNAIEGPLAGQSLAPVIAINHFWFSWAAFRPDTTIYKP